MPPPWDGLVVARWRLELRRSTRVSQKNCGDICRHRADDHVLWRPPYTLLRTRHRKTEGVGPKSVAWTPRGGGASSRALHKCPQKRTATRARRIGPFFVATTPQQGRNKAWRIHHTPKKRATRFVRSKALARALLGSRAVVEGSRLAVAASRRGMATRVARSLPASGRHIGGPSGARPANTPSA